MLVEAFSSYAVSKYDPTKTLTLRNTFARELRGQFRRLAALANNAIVNERALSLAGRNAGTAVTGFMTWFNGQVRATISESTVDKYTALGYQRGIMRGVQELRNAGYAVPTIDAMGGVMSVFRQPFHQDRMDLLYARVNSDLRGILDAMTSQVSRVLAQSITEGRTPREIARLISSVIVGPPGNATATLGRFMPALRRAEILARSEVVRAHHSATVQTYKDWGADEVKVQAEWVTAGDDRVCPDCQEMEGRVFNLDEIEGMIPLHPACRCIAMPLEETT